MRFLVFVLVRLLGLGAILVLGYRLIDLLASDGDANIGAGLMVFAALMLVSFLWALVDGVFVEPARLFGGWAAAAVLYAIAWLVVLSAYEADASMSTGELIRDGLVDLPFTIGLVLMPALFGGLLSWAIVQLGGQTRR